MTYEDAFPGVHAFDGSYTEMTDNNVPVQTAFLSVSLDGPVGFVVGDGSSLEEIQRFISGKKAEHCFALSRCWKKKRSSPYFIRI